MLRWLILISFIASPAFAKERIIWYKPNWPPYYESSGPKTGQGYIDKLLDYLQTQFPDVQFDSNYYALSSLEQMRQQRPNTCNVSHLRTPAREKIAYFTAFYIQPPPSLVFRLEDWRNKIYEAKVFSLEKLLNEKNLRGGFSADRSYGSPLDALIRKNRNSSSVSMITGAADSTSMINMLNSKKFDYVLEYEEVAHYVVDNKLAEGPLGFSEVEEQRSPVVVHIACSKTDWGKKTILALDKSLQKIASTAKYRHLMEDWHSPQIRETYRKDFDDFYKKRASASWTNIHSP